MLTAHTIKILQSLDKKKFRQKYNLFLVEGNKIIRELANSCYTIKEIYSTSSDEIKFLEVPIHTISENELKKISFLKTPKDSVAVCFFPEPMQMQDQKIQLILDGIQDPGNLGTIIRLADWFGIEQIICSEDTVDVYNPKVIQATKGSFVRVNVLYTDIVKYLSQSNNQNIGTDMDGENIFDTEIPKHINLILGNEGNGMRLQTKKQLHRTITIPRFGKSQSTESLNVSMAAGIILAQIFSNKK